MTNPTGLKSLDFMAKFLADNPGITIQQVMDRLVAAEARERALIDELTEARHQRDAYKADADREWGASATERTTLLERATNAEHDRDVAMKLSLDRADALANARAVMAEEAARWHVNRLRELEREASTSDAEHERRAGKMAAHERSADAMSMLAPLPPSVRCVPTETLEDIDKALKAAWDCGSHHTRCALEPNGPDCNCWRSLVYAVLPANREQP